MGENIKLLKRAFYKMYREKDSHLSISKIINLFLISNIFSYFDVNDAFLNETIFQSNIKTPFFCAQQIKINIKTANF